MDSEPEIGDRGAEVAFMRIKDMTVDQEWSLCEGDSFACCFVLSFMGL